MMIYELWKDTDGSINLFSASNSSARALLEDGAVQLTTFEAATWEEACQIRNDFLGWGKYQPWQDPCAVAS